MPYRIYEKLVILATKCVVYSIRSTCFNVLGLIGGTNDGANILYKLSMYFYTLVSNISLKLLIVPHIPIQIG